MDTDTANLVIFGLIHLLLPGALVVRAFRSPSPSQLTAWAAMYGLEVTDRNRPVLFSYLRRGRRFRVTPAALVWTVSGLSLLTGEPLPFRLDGISPLYAYFAGAVLAVLTVPGSQPTGSTRHARLESRAIDDYLASHVRRLGWGTTAVVLALLPVYAAVAGWARELPEARMGDRVLSVWALAPGIVVAVGVALLSELAQRRLVARAQPVASADLVAADDVVRAASVAVAAGAGLVVVLGALVSELEAMARLMTTDWLRWPLHLLALSTVLLAVSSIMAAFRPEPWWFGRRHAERAAA